MRVKFQDQWITGDTMRVRPRSLRVDGGPVIQDAQFLRAAQAKAYDRGNRRTTISFELSREHADVEASEVFMLDHFASLPTGTGLLLLIAEASTGREQDFFLADTVLRIVGSVQVGASTDHTYEFSGGLLSKEKPAS